MYRLLVSKISLEISENFAASTADTFYPLYNSTMKMAAGRELSV
jgi:hypothetical protein